VGWRGTGKVRSECVPNQRNRLKKRVKIWDQNKIKTGTRKGNRAKKTGKKRGQNISVIKKHCFHQNSIKVINLKAWKPRKIERY